jgi:hypothetical protein
MLKNLSYQKKYYLSLLSSVLLAIIIYQFAISKTISLYQKNQDLNTKLKEAVNTPAQLETIYKNLASLNKFIQSNQSDSAGSVHDALLGILSRYCKENGTLLKSFPETSFYTEGNFEIQTNTFTLQGSFVPLLRLVYLLEQKERIGKVSSLNFQATKDYDSKKTVLPVTVYLQTAKNVK